MALSPENRLLLALLQNNFWQAAFIVRDYPLDYETETVLGKPLLQSYFHNEQQFDRLKFYGMLVIIGFFGAHEETRFSHSVTDNQPFQDLERAQQLDLAQNLFGFFRVNYWCHRMGAEYAASARPIAPPPVVYNAPPPAI